MLMIKAAEGENLVHPSATVENSTVIPPCFLGENVVIKDSIIGPHVTIGTGTKIEKCELKNSLIQNNSVIQQLDCSNAMIGNNVHYNGNHTFVSIGDYSELK
jgi:glucose-1-phosphate thymidylyltransferase